MKEVGTDLGDGNRGDFKRTGIAARLDKEPHQCSQRWQLLRDRDAGLKTDPFDEQENLKILHLVEELGRKWAEIAKRLNRPQVLLKNDCTNKHSQFASRLEAAAPKPERKRKVCE